MDLEQAYKLVYDDLIKCELLKGKYDATNGKKHYMYGISTVMEIIAYRADKTGVLHDLFEDMFLQNMMKSEEKGNKLGGNMKEVKEPFNTKYPTWIIAFCPDTNSFFVTNERHFFWESEEKFNSENDGINYFEHNISYFINIANEITHTEEVWLENTSKWYKSF